MAYSSNFREISGEGKTSHTLYRSNHPICDKKQVKDIALRASSARIKTVLNLSDSTTTLKSKMTNCPWYKKLFDENSVIALNMNMQFDIIDEKFAKKIKAGLLFIIEHDGPYLIHCEAGIDRTGFLALILEAFLGMDFDALVKDYMLSYVDKHNYSQNDYDRGSVYIQNTFSIIKGGLLDKGEDLQKLSSEYLVKKAALTTDELCALKTRLTKTYI